MRIECSEPFERMMADGTIVQSKEVTETHHEEGGDETEERTLCWEMTISDDSEVIRLRPMAEFRDEEMADDDGDGDDDEA